MTSPEVIFTICRRTVASPYHILKSLIATLTATSPIVIDVPNRGLQAVESNNSFLLCLSKIERESEVKSIQFSSQEKESNEFDFLICQSSRSTCINSLTSPTELL